MRSIAFIFVALALVAGTGAVAAEPVSPPATAAAPAPDETRDGAVPDDGFKWHFRIAAERCPEDEATKHAAEELRMALRACDASAPDAPVLDVRWDSGRTWLVVDETQPPSPLLGTGLVGLGTGLVGCVERVVPTLPALARCRVFVRRQLSSDVNVAKPTPGTLSKRKIRKTVRSIMPQIRVCFEDQLRGNPDLHGRLDLRWLISWTGVTSGVSVVNNELNDGVADCVVDVIRMLEFGRPKNGGVVVVNYPFVFRQQ